MNHSEKFLRKRKALLLMPLPAFLFITLAFWSLGGGKGNGTAQAQQKPGINATLPNAQLASGSLDKMSLYDKAAADSQTMKNQAGSDLFAVTDTIKSKGADTAHGVQKTGISPSGTGDAAYSDPNEAKVRTKLAQLDKVLNQPQPGTATGNEYATPPHDPDIDAQLNQLQQAVQQMNQSNGQDPQLQQMNGMLEKILDIQHPDRVQQQLKEQSVKNRGRVYPVSKPEEQTGAGLIGRTDTPAGNSTAYVTGNGFYNAGENADADSDNRPAVPAVVQETQTVTSGATIKLRLTEDVMINGIQVPGNTFVHGKCNVDGERLKIDITGIEYRNSIFPVSMTVYDNDAIEGIRIPGAIGRDASKEGTDRGIQSMQLMSLDPSLGAQAASAGLEAVKGFASKKVKLVRVTVKAGYPVLLLDQKARQDNN